MKTIIVEKDRTAIQYARNNFKRWNQALLSQDPSLVAALYASDATFLPTQFWGLKIGKLGALEYFRHFLESNPEGVIVRDSASMLGSGTYLHWGDYNFTVGPINNRKIIKAQFSFIWTLVGADGWLIVHHHSSAEALPGADAYYFNFFNNKDIRKIIKESARPLTPNCILQTGLFKFENTLYQPRRTDYSRFTLVWEFTPTYEARLAHKHLSTRP